MQIARRECLAGILSVAAASAVVVDAQGTTPMYGLIAKLLAVPNRRDDLIAILRDGATQMPGCLSYVIAKDAADESTIWVTELWRSEADHAASLSLPVVKDAIAKGRPLIASFSRIAETQPVAGVSSAAK